MGGSFAWGGRHQVLPSRTRVGSALAILIYALFAMVALDRAGIIHSFPGTGFSTAAMRVSTAFLVLSIVQNLFSKSSRERLAMTPVVIFRENQ